MDEIELWDKTIIAVKESISNYASREADANEMIGIFLDDSAVDLIADNIADYVVDEAGIWERALKNAVSQYRCEQCPIIDCSAEIRGSQECIDCICEVYKRQAEREIEEEKRK